MIHISGKIHYVMFYNKDGKYHRINGPAYIHGDYQAWYLNDKLHREDGPAVIRGNYQAWYLNDIQYNETDYLASQEHDLAKQEHDHNKLKEMGLV